LEERTERREVLPAPEGPISAVREPRAKVKLILLRMVLGCFPGRM